MSLLVCRAPGCGGALFTVLEAGKHPVSNGYVHQDEEPLSKALTLCQCKVCGLLQLAGTFSEEELATAVPDWVRYNEPEAHLDQVTDLLASLLVGGHGCHVAGMTYIDQSLQGRLKNAGWESQSSLDVVNGADPVVRCSIEAMLAGVQSGLWQHGGRKIDLLLARHVLDHTRDTAAFITFIRSCLADGGMVVFEVPSSIPDIEALNPLMLWESHANYFTPRTLLATLESAGLNVVACRQYTPGGTPVLVVVCSVGGTVAAKEEWQASDITPEALKVYVEHFHPNREKLRHKLKSTRERHGKVVMLGAGHIGSLFLNLHDLGGFLDCVADDDARKSGFFLPGSRLPIQAGSTLAGGDDLFVLMAVNPSVEERVIERWRRQNPTAVFGSIFPQSTRSVLSL